MNKSKKILHSFLIWRVKHIKEKHFVMIGSLLVGLAGGLVALVIKDSTHYLEYLLTNGFNKEHHHFLYFVYPVIGILLVYLVSKYILRGKIGHGVPSALYAISKKSSIIKPISTYAPIITSALTVGFGGSVGLEGPTMSAGSAMGSNIGRILRLNYKTRTLYIGCGCAAGIASIFNAPIAAVVLALEIFMLDLTTASLIPLFISSVTGTLTSRLIIGNKIFFNIQFADHFVHSNILFYILLGIFTGLVSVFFNRTVAYLEDSFEKFKSDILRLLVGTSILGVLIFLIPPLYGEGYPIVKLILHGHFRNLVNNSLFYGQFHNTALILGLIFVMIWVKAFATGLTFASGGVGGIFAPSMFLGASSGFVLAKAADFFGIAHLSEVNFTLVGISGVIAGIVQAPLTGIFLIAETSGSYFLMLPLMITVLISYVTVKYFEPNSFYTRRLAKKGDLITHHKDKAVLTLMKLNTEIERDFTAVNINGKLKDLTKAVMESHRNIFPVLNNENELCGVILLDHIRHIMFKSEMYDKVTVTELMISPPAVVFSDENMKTVMDKFNETKAWNLPVIDAKKHTYIGFISKSNIFNAYRKLLIDFSED